MKKKKKRKKRERVLISTVQGSGSGATTAAAADGDEDGRDDPEHPCPLRMRFKQGFFTHSFIYWSERAGAVLQAVYNLLCMRRLSSLSFLLPLFLEADGLHDESPNWSVCREPYIVSNR